MSSIVIVKNPSLLDITIEDLGITIDSTSQLNISDLYEESILFNSEDLKNLVENEELIINNGIEDLDKFIALKYISFGSEYEIIHDTQDSTSNIEVQLDSVTVLKDTKIINFTGGVDITKEGLDKVTIDIKGQDIEQSGIYNLSLNDSTCTIIFDIPFSNTMYMINTSISNIIDDPPSIYLFTIVEKTINGFIIEFSDKIDSNNYKLEWMAIKRAEIQNGTINLTEDSTSEIVTLYYPFSDTSYSIYTTISNYIDNNSSIYGTIITKKNINSFEVTFSDKIDSNNYVLVWGVL